MSIKTLKGTNNNTCETFVKRKHNIKCYILSKSFKYALLLIDKSSDTLANGSSGVMKTSWLVK